MRPQLIGLALGLLVGGMPVGHAAPAAPDDDRNAAMQARCHELLMALEQYVVDHNGRCPTSSREFIQEVIRSGDYLPSRALPSNPWGGVQLDLLRADTAGLNGPPHAVTTPGVVLGSGVSEGLVSTIRNYGAFAYASDGQRFTLYGVGRRGDLAILVFAIRNY